MADTLPATILVVDDNEWTRSGVARALRRGGFAVREAPTGTEGLRLAAERPDLIILDINLPDVSGYDVCRQLKGDSATASIPVLHLSATLVESENRSLGLEGGADGYLAYPVEPRELLAHVGALLRARRAEQEIARLLAAERRHAERLRRVATASLTINAAGTLDGVLRAVTEEARQILGARLAVSILSPGADQARPIQVVSPAGEVAPPDPGELPARVCQSNRPVRLSGAESGAHAGWLAAPFVGRNGRNLGLIQLCGAEGEFTEADESALVQLAQIASVAIENARLVDTLRENDRLKDEFLAMLAHELRNPLAPVLNAVHVLRLRGAEDPDSRWATDVVNRQVQQLARLVDDLMDVSRISRGKINLQKEVLDLATVVGRAVETSRPLIEARRHALDVLLPDRPVHVQGDPVRLAQVLLNLLNNAAKYTPEGGRIRLAVEADGSAVVRVRDTGVGIAAEMLPRVFDLFAQVERTLDRAEGGLGIGLTLVKRLVELHGGSVEAHSEGPGQGSEFVVRLPALAEGPPERPAAPAAPPEARPAEGRRVLVVDDNVDSANSLAMLLRLLGHEVRTAHDGPHALAEAEAYRPEVVVLDIGLPGLNGYEVARALRGRPELSPALLLALSGYGGPEDRRRSQQAGFDAHLVKPVELEVLQGLLDRAPAGAAH